MQKYTWLLVLGLLGCGDTLEIGWAEDVNRAVHVPVSGAVGVPVEIEITINGGCRVVADSTDVDLDDDTVAILPWDRREDDDGRKCLAILGQLHHDVAITFPTAGTKTVQVHLRHSEDAETQFVVTRHVEVE